MIGLAGATIPELSWTEGQPFPTVNGLIIFPSLAPRLPGTLAAQSYATHWYAGSVYPSWLPTQNAVTICTTINVPSSGPLSDEFYYVLLSAWDSAGSYDQLGFSDTWGTWGLTYSWTSGPPSNPTYHYSSNAMPLSLGVAYTFYITTQSGVTHFAAYQGSSQVWSLDASTGGNYLVLSYSYSGYYDYTDYEEVWYTSTPGGAPAFSFYFYNNYWIPTGGGSNAATWSSWTSSGTPSNVVVVISGDSVLVTNPTYTVTFAESGIPSGTSWGVTVGGNRYTSSTPRFVLTGLSGSVGYSYDSSVSGSGGDYVCTSGCSGTIDASGSDSRTATYTFQSTTVTSTQTVTSTRSSTMYSYGTTTTTTTSYTSTTTSTSTIPTVTTVVLVPLTITSTDQSTQYLTSILTTTVTSYTSTTTSTSTIPTTVALVPLTMTSTVQSTQLLTSILTTTVTSYTDTQTSTSTIVVPTTIVLVPSTVTSTVQSIQYLTSFLTTTATSYTSTSTLTSTIPTVTTVVLLPSTVTSTIQGTQYLTSILTTTVTSYTATTTSTSTWLVYTTVTASPGGAGAGASSPLGYVGFLSLVALAVERRVTAGKRWRTPNEAFKAFDRRMRTLLRLKL